MPLANPHVNPANHRFTLSVRFSLFCGKLLFLWLLMWSADNSWAQPTPQLHALSQHVGQAGTTIPVQVIAVEQGDQVSRLVFSHPDITARLLTDPAGDPTEVPSPKYGHFEVSIGPLVAAGIYDVSVVGAAGVSNSRAFRVTTRPVVVSDPTAVDSSEGAPLPLERLVWERFRGSQVQRFHLDLQAGQWIQVQAEAQSLDSNALPVLVLRDNLGIEVARGRAVKQSPAMIRYPVPSDGRYSLDVQDMLYQSGADYYYTLEARIIPTESAATEPTSTESVAASTSALETGELATGESATEGDSSEAAIGMATAAELMAWVQALRERGDRRQRREIGRPTAVITSGDWATGAGALDLSAVQTTAKLDQVHSLPVVVAGVFPERSEPVRIDFQGLAGQVVCCEVVSAGAEEWTDPKVLLYRVRQDEQGTESLQLLTHQDDAPGVGTGPVAIASGDPSMVATLPEEGRYCVLVLDQVTSPRPADHRRFVISVAAPQPDFQLISHSLFFNNDPAQARPLGTHLAPGGTAAWHVHILRRQGFVDAIELTVEGLPEGVHATPVTVHPSVNQATVVVQGVLDLAASCDAIRIVGRGVRESMVRRVAWPATVFQAASPRRNKVRWGLVTETRLLTVAGPPAAMGMSWASSQLDVVAGQPSTAVLNLERREGGAGQGIVRPVQLPPGWTVSEVTIPPDQTQGSVNIQLPADTPAGRYTLNFHNETKIQWKPNTEAAAQEIQVWLPVPPLTINVTPM